MATDDRPLCPRCAYDLSGEVSRWETECPLEGVCPECGLRLAWRDVMDPRWRAPEWYVEGVDRWSPRRFVGTWVRHVRPGLLWSSLDLRMPLRWRRLAEFVVQGLLCAHLLLAATQLALEVYNALAYVRFWAGRGRTSLPSPWALIDWPAVAWPYGVVLGQRTGAAWPLAVLLWPSLVGVVALCLCFLFSDTLRLERVRLLHLVRVGAMWVASAVMAGTIVVVMLGVFNQAPGSALARVIGWAFLPTVLVLLVAWPVVFWWRVFGAYLRFRQPFLATIVLGFCSVVIAGGVMVLYWMVLLQLRW